jgi:hypothetical protein
VPLSQLSPIHVVTHAVSMPKLNARADALRAAKADGRVGEVLTLADQQAIIPSVRGLEAVRHDSGRVVVLEGNSRLEAIFRAFGRDSAMPVEVELYDTRSRVVQKLLDAVLDGRDLSLRAARPRR